MKTTIKEAAKFVKSGESSSFVSRILTSVARVFTFTQERANRFKRFVVIVGAYRRGSPVRDIEAKYGCSRGTILRYARLAGLAKRPKAFDPELRAKVIALYKDKKSLVEIEALTGVSQAYISKEARKEGISRRKPWTKKKR